MLIDTLNNFKDDLASGKGHIVALLLRYNRRITDELVKVSEKKQLPEYLGLRSGNDGTNREEK
jgi:hypothetical protein